MLLPILFAAALAQTPTAVDPANAETSTTAEPDTTAAPDGTAAPQGQPVPDEPTDSDPPPPEAAPPEPTVGELELVWAKQDPEDVLIEARIRIDTRDFAGADARLSLLARTTDAPIVWFERGRSLELQERCREALAAYELAGQKATELALQRDITYRSAICLNDLQRHDEARTQMRLLAADTTLDPAAVPVVELELGIAEAGLGKRKGSRRIAAVIEQLGTGSTDHAAWARSRARFMLTRLSLDEAADIPLQGNKRAARNLLKRAEALKAAEQQVVAIAKTGEPEYALAGILALGDAYLELHDDFLAAPPPRKLDSEQADLYRQEIASRAAVLRDKAFRFYDEGVQFAARVQWHGGVTERLRSRRDSLQAPSGAAHEAAGS